MGARTKERQLAPVELLKRPYVKTLGRVDYSRRTSDVFIDFVTLSSCALSMGTREDEYLKVVARYKPEGAKLIAQAFAELVMDMEEHPYTDLLGSVYLDSQSSSTKQVKGEFYTPQHVSDVMAMMLPVAEGLPEDRPLTLLEPASGAGGMVLSAAKTLRDAGVSPLVLKATCIDINLTSVMMCHINLTLNGIPAMCVHGNTLTVEEWRHLPTMFWYQARAATPEERGEAATAAPYGKTQTPLPSGVHTLGSGCKQLSLFDLNLRERR